MHVDELKGLLDAAVAERNLLEHPFYRAWSAGELTLEDLQHYATQYWRQVEAFPSYLRAVAGKTEGGVRDVILENLSDEVDGKHDELWLDFAAAVGATRTHVAAAPVEPETERCVEAFHVGTDVRSAAFGLGMLYGYESQTPAVADTKVRGLDEHYGIAGEAARYFALHGELDVEHADDLAGAISAHAGDDANRIDEAVAGARTGAAAVWVLLDGVERQRGAA